MYDITDNYFNIFYALTDQFVLDIDNYYIGLYLGHFYIAMQNVFLFLFLLTKHRQVYFNYEYLGKYMSL